MRPAVLRNQQVHVFFPPPHSARAMNANYVRSAKRDRWLGDTHFPRLILGVSFLSRIVRVPWNHWENTFAFLCRSEPSRAESSYGRSKIERDKSQRETLKFNERESGKVGVIVADYWRKRRGIELAASQFRGGVVGRKMCEGNTREKVVETGEEGGKTLNQILYLC